MIDKKKLDKFGGVGSLLAGLMCLYFADRHHFADSMSNVWVGFCILLVGNGILMLVHASKQGGLPAVARELVSGPQKPAHGKMR